MYDNYNYPIGADAPKAPWNQENNPKREIEVVVSITLSKVIKIKVDDYTIEDKGKDENGDYFENIDYSSCKLKEKVIEQYPTPDIIMDKLAEYANNNPMWVYPNYVPEVFEGWNVDDFEVCLN